MLSQLFTSFDKECNRLNLYKVYTIGDCYVVMSFLDKNNRLPPEKECADVLEMGFKMIEIISRVREEINFDGLHMRIGLLEVYFLAISRLFPKSREGIMQASNKVLSSFVLCIHVSKMSLTAPIWHRFFQPSLASQSQARSSPPPAAARGRVAPS